MEKKTQFSWTIQPIRGGGMADLTSEANVPLLPLNSTPQYMLLRYIPTCMLHVCIAIERISCFLDSMAEIMAE